MAQYVCRSLVGLGSECVSVGGAVALYMSCCPRSYPIRLQALKPLISNLNPIYHGDGKFI